MEISRFIQRICSCCLRGCYSTPIPIFNRLNQKEDVIPQLANEMIEFGEYSHLQNVTWKDCKPYVPLVSCGKVIKVYDGDTITIASKLQNSTDDTIYRFSVRLLGIDSAEMKSKNEIEKLHAIQARDALSSIVFNQMVELRNVSTEKYGRLLADVYCKNIHLNEWMIRNNYAVPYDGGTKQIPSEWRQ
jgi:endonuclease YncB( thermonuclease family)